MANVKLFNGMTKAFYKTKLGLKKHSPEILLVAVTELE